jgi:hypothetical protein
MCNCGNKRAELAGSGSFDLSRPVNYTPGKMWEDVNFEYTGKSALSVKGNISGRNYRFSKPGDVQLIDYRDASAMKTIPVLKMLKG